MRIPSLLICLSSGLFAHSQDFYLITGNYNAPGATGIHVYRFDAATGKTEVADSIATNNPSYLTLSANGKQVYAVNSDDIDGGAVSAFSFDPKRGKLKLINRQPSLGGHPCHLALDPTGRWLVVANYVGGNFSVYPVQKNGSLGNATQVIRHEGSSINRERQEMAHVHATVFTPDERYLCVVDLGIDKIMVYPFDASAEKPAGEPSEVNLEPGSGPRHLVFHPGGHYAFVIEELSGKVSAFRYADGQFQHIQTIDAHPEGYSGEIGSAAIRVSGDGKFLYASNRGESNTIAVFEINPSTGTLTLQEIVKSGGRWPRDIQTDPTGGFLLSANGPTNNIRIFRRNMQTGLLEDSGQDIFTHNPVCLVFAPRKR